MSGAVIVAPAKVTDYLLNASHPTGASKAKFFRGFGFDMETPEKLMQALRDHPRQNEIQSIAVGRAGVKSIIACRIATPDGRNPCIRTIWALEPGATMHRFVTAYPTRRR